MEDKLKKFYITSPSWSPSVRVDDFIVTIGVKQSNSVYHVAEVKTKPYKERLIRYHVKVYVSDLITALKRNKEQRLIPITWDKR